MHGAPSGPGNAGVEDLDSVLSRFQDWSRTRSSRSVAENDLRSNIGRGTSSKKANLAAGARELSYEEALRASSYRRRGHQSLAQTAPPQTIDPVAELQDLDLAAKVADRGRSAPAATASSTRSPKLANNTEARAGRRARMAASPVVETSSNAVGATAASQSAMTAEMPGRSPVQRRKTAPPRGSKTVQRAIVQAAITQPAIAQAGFREVLQQTAGLATAAKDGATLASKTVALSLRVSDAEQARIQACAARANVSVSAYLRQCALGVEELRDQVELALGELRKRDVQKPAPPELSAIPGILRHVAAGWFRRLRGQSDYTGISLR